MTELLNKLIKVASAEVGYHEGTNNDNQYGIEYGWNNVAWCCIFAWWICNKSGVDFPKCAHCNQVEAYARNNGRWVTENYKVGDFVIFDYDLNGERDHIGFIVGIGEDNYVTTIEGNYSDKVSKVFRKTSEFVGAYRPDYGEETSEETSPTTPVEEPESVAPCLYAAVNLPILISGDFGPAVGAVQAILESLGYNTKSKMTNGKMDCEFGTGTETALEKFQKAKSVSASEYGATGVETWKALIGGIG